ncbi:hypothetical protein FW781_00415 (plasmid) [Chryseobacterium panacisoli]|uniref:Uncharacterized protein n=1 Tax=Chryseobacterium panacisoli TaxID=1807141 RepID=A0A5D8ZU13_9FLAO|nr:hypothetical protein [Chryseobacterium panacisoli]TZF98429.1 hypothetical protein FW781_00415 [Chryseobacterium panacisoli]
MTIEMFEDLILYLKGRTDSAAVECLSKIYALADRCQSEGLMDIGIPEVLIIDYLNFKDGL